MNQIEIQVHIDLETLGLRRTSRILSMGVYVPHNELTLYTEVDQRSYIGDARFTEDDSVVTWWAERGGFIGSAAQQVSHHEMCLQLQDFFFELAESCDMDVVTVWANSPQFDLELLRYHFDIFSLRMPWSYWAERDFRTVRGTAKMLDLPIERAEVPHHALEDAKLQATYVRRVYETLARDRQLAVEAMRKGIRLPQGVQ